MQISFLIWFMLFYLNVARGIGGFGSHGSMKGKVSNLHISKSGDVKTLYGKTSIYCNTTVELLKPII